jgi:hypothetical protein
VTAGTVEAAAAIGALVISVWGTTTHYVGRAQSKRRTWNRIEDAIFGYPGEPGILKRLDALETQGRSK